MILLVNWKMSGMQTKYFRMMIFLIVAASLHACGFQLRGAIDISQEISPIYIEQNSVFDLAREIRSLLATNKIEVVTNAGQSKSQLVLLNEERTRRVLSVDGSGRAREYLLIYKINFSINTKSLQSHKEESDTVEQNVVEQNAAKDNKDTVSRDSITVRRSLLFDPDAVLAVTNEAEILYKDMRRDVARLILLKLQALSKGSKTTAVKSENVNTQ